MVLGVTLVASLFVERPWCRYACPLGAATGLVSKLSPVYLKREGEACKSCAICSKSCPMGLNVHTADTIKSQDCIGCLECVGCLPAEGRAGTEARHAADRQVDGRKEQDSSMKLNPWIFGSSSGLWLIFMGTIGAAKATGVWSVSGKVSDDGREGDADWDEPG